MRSWSSTMVVGVWVWTWPPREALSTHQTETSAWDASASPAHESLGSEAAQGDEGHFHAMLTRETTSNNRKSRAWLGRWGA
ncbi:hypothetical protein B0T18DRAFT_411745 [Schizothecium vesticola]|uniref:Secreted protein n=1 Tax=Schizothecium vesticola TaxID=314040 RepID=A0AA40K5B0_9PEZI|nr:hypothetical protein B0T18DRAFT_411745 [Schizothecium vesticola]